MMRFPWTSLAIFLLTIAVTAGVSAPTSAADLGVAEQWVVAQVNAGQVADLSQFADEAQRKLSARFLEDLLTGALPSLKPQRQGVQISNAIVKEPIDLRNAEIAIETSLRDCRFSSELTFARAKFIRAVSFESSAFEKAVDFSGIKAGSDVLFSGAVFAASLRLSGAEIAGSFAADGARFSDPGEIAFFNGMKVGYLALFQKAVFAGEVDFGAVSVAKDFRADEAQFTNAAQPVNFNGAKIKHSILLRKAVFAGSANFGSTDIERDLDAREVQFKNPKQEAVFDSMKVGHIASFDQATVEGPANFDGAEIASCSFDRTTFRSAVSFQHASFLNLQFKACRGESAPMTRVDLVGSSIKRSLLIRQMRLEELDARWLRAEGTAIFTDLFVERAADLRYSDFATLDLIDTRWPHQPNSFELQGMSYKSIRAAPTERRSHNVLLKLADQATYSAGVYGTLREFFSRQGFSADADRAFIAEKRRERREYLKGFRWFGSYLLDLLVGYGRHPWQAAIPCAFFVALGTCLFAPHSMEPQKPDEPYPAYNRYWYSFSLFVPFVHLQADRLGGPRMTSAFSSTTRASTSCSDGS
jgi:uncharacterized protein YjbI with pentapeptide repeats